MKNIVTAIESDGYNIAESGVFLLPEKNSSVKISLDDVEIDIVFKNYTELQDEKDKIIFNSLSEKRLEIICQNWRNTPFGIGLTSPIAVGELDRDEKKEVLYFKFLVFSINDIPYTIYAFYTRNKDT